MLTSNETKFLLSLIGNVCLTAGGGYSDDPLVAKLQAKLSIMGEAASDVGEPIENPLHDFRYPGSLLAFGQILGIMTRNDYDDERRMAEIRRVLEAFIK